MLKTTFAALRSARPLASILAAALFAGIFPAPAEAVRPEPEHRSDAERFNLRRTPRTTASSWTSKRRTKARIRKFNEAARGRRPLRFGPAGVGGATAAAGEARRATAEVVKDFLKIHGKALGINPDEIRLELARTSRGYHHLLFTQIVDGIPVEFSRLKVHLAQDGTILGLNSSLRPEIRAARVPGITETAAAAKVASDLGTTAPRGGALVFYPDRDGDGIRLAWKFQKSGAGGSWVYYIDAQTGELLFRFNDLRFQVCQTSGTITGEVFDLDPNATALAARPIRHQKVYVVDASTFVLTDDNGFFCSGTPGRISTALQGPFVNVAHFNGPNAHYDNGGGTWQTVSSPLSSAHPYANNVTVLSTITVVSSAVRVLPLFSTFDVGSIDGAFGDITDNDQAAILDADGNVVATYVGNRAAFQGASVPGNRLNIRLTTSGSGTHNGFDINVSSFLTLDPAIRSTPQNETATFTWTSAHTFDGAKDEVNLFYQINLMHDYFRTRVSSGLSSAFLDIPITVMARVGPNLANAFYDPVHKNLSFGDVGSFANDATVVRHEYVHFVVDRIYPIVNFGQNGAISEAIADYFSASSLGVSAIGAGTQNSLGGVGSFRDLDCPAQSPCIIFPTSWSGLIHQDSLMISQALWEIRQKLIDDPPTPGPALDCADGLVYQTLFFFPDSFQEFLEAMLAVDANSANLVPACGDNRQRGLILAQFAVHGIFENPTDEDIYEPNDGIQSATDITTAPVISARIFPQADLDYYAIGAGPGLMKFTMTLPENPAAPGNYFAYTMNLIDSRHEIVATALPALDVNPTLSGFCPEPPSSDCMTTQRSFILTYSNPSSQQFYLAVTAPAGDESLVSRNNSTRFYRLTANYNRAGPVTSSIVSASFDNDLFNFNVAVSSYLRRQNYSFHSAQLRDHTLETLLQTRTNVAGTFLTMLSSTSAFGIISGQLRLTPGLDSRHPSLGTVHLEIFGVNPIGNVQSFGFSPGINLTANKSELSAWNNVFNPARGDSATFRYETQSAGRVRLRLFTMSGTHVMTLIDEDKPAGKGSIDWNGANGKGTTVASGIYLLHLEAPGINKTQKVVVVK